MNYFLLIDGHALIYRAYHAFPDLTAPDGRLVNAVYGFSRIMLTALRNFDPEYAAVAFDHHAPTFRHQLDETYKAQREDMPQELVDQLEPIKQVVEALNIPQFELAGYEADDLIGTLARQAEKLVNRRKLDLSVVIVTGDKDSLQLVNDVVHVWMPARGKKQVAAEYDRAAVVKKMGVAPGQVVDLKALMGDSSDNIPGVKGIGAKTAAVLLQAFGNLDRLYKVVDGLDDDGKLPPRVGPSPDRLSRSPDRLSAPTDRLSAPQRSALKPAVVSKLCAGREAAYQSQQLAAIVTDVPIKLDLELCRVTAYHKDRVLELFDRLGFMSLVKLLPPDTFETELQEALF